MRLQERDEQIIRFVQFIGDGIASRRHLKDVFWSEARTDRAMDRRLSKLREKGYIHWPTKTHYRTKSVPSRERIIWLGPKGAWLIAHTLGYQLKYPDELSETWKRDLEKVLRSFGARWLREPRWIQLMHDIEAIDFRLAIESAQHEMPGLFLEEWRPESSFRANYDKVEYRVLGGDEEVRHGKRGIQPDGYFVIVNKVRLDAGLLSRRRFLLEIDQGTTDLDRFAEKFLAGGPSYINGRSFKKRFGDNKAHWLVITTGKVRMKHLIDKANEKVGSGASAFLFTTTRKWKKENVLTSPIWAIPGESSLVSLFPSP